jgi:hypothetical protein
MLAQSLVFALLTPLTTLHSLVLSQYPTMSIDSPTGTKAEAVTILSGMMPMLDSLDPHDNAFKMVSINFVVVAIFFCKNS